MENPDKAAAIAGTGAALAGGANKVIRSINRNVTLKQVEREKRRRVYDHSLNAYVYTKKPLTKEQIEFIHKERRRTGKKVSEIMAEMDILRKQERVENIAVDEEDGRDVILYYFSGGFLK